MKQSDGKGKMVPDHNFGSKLDTHHEVSAASPDEAKALFRLASARLLDVNVWDKICGPLSAEFRLTDEAGNKIPGPAKPGDHFRINIPGPGPSAGEGFDWVEVEALEDKRDPNGAKESVTLRVRPSPSPANNDQDTAHFFSDDATSSFRVTREGNTVRAEVHGRNEVANTDVSTVTDKVRNAVVGTGARAGMSAPQWKSLVTGLLDTEKDVA